MLDMYDFNNDIWLCHSFNAQCYNATAFVSTLIYPWLAIAIVVPFSIPTLIISINLQQPAINVLKEIQVFLEGNPTEIVTIFIEDYVTSSQGLSKVFNASGLTQYFLPPSQMPQNGQDWPTVDDMVQRNQRLVVFTSKSTKEASEGIAYEWKYVVENQCESESSSKLIPITWPVTNWVNNSRLYICRWERRNDKRGVS